jgi:hypothetical protein
MDRPRSSSPGLRAETGAITIMVALTLLVFLTLVAVAMSRSSLREVVTSGTTRQASQARNDADSGIEWTIFWQDYLNAPVASGTAQSLGTLTLKLLQDDTLCGVPYNPLNLAVYNPASPPSPPADLQLGAIPGTTQGFTIGLTRMGKLPITDMSQSAGTGGFSPAQGTEVKQAPDLWAVRSDAQLLVGSGLGATLFRQSKEAWISTPVQQ